MKAVKFLLVILVVAGLGYLAVSFLGPEPKPVDNIDGIIIENKYVADIEAMIEKLINKPASEFCVDYYEEIANKIDYCCERKHFDKKDEKHNASIAERERQRLFTAYISLFVKQSYYVFNGSEWNVNKIKAIKKMTADMKKSKFMERGADADLRLDSINYILKKYDAATSFYYRCSNFSYNYYVLDSLYPVNSVQYMLNKANDYETNGFGNDYVNNCKRLKQQIDEIPQILFKKHYKYYNNKIDSLCTKFADYDDLRHYKDNLFDPMKSQFPQDRLYANIGRFAPLMDTINHYYELAEKYYNSSTIDNPDDEDSDDDLLDDDLLDDFE